MSDRNVKSRIDIHNDAQRARWAAELGVSEAVLRAAVRKFGNDPGIVRACLGIQ